MRFGLVAAALAAALALSSTQASGADEDLVVAFQTSVLSGPGDPSDVVLADAAGERTLNLTPPVAGAGERDSEQTPTWSPHGTELAYAAHIGVDRDEILAMHADGTGKRLLTTDSGGGRLWNTSPEWSPDGRHITWLKATPNDAEVWIMSPDGSAQRPLTATGGRKHGLAWSPDGTHLLFESEATPPSIFSIDLASGAVRDLTPEGAWDSGADWSPDGRRIAFTHVSPRYDREIYIDRKSVV